MICWSVVIIFIFVVACSTEEQKVKKKFIETIEKEFIALQSKEDVQKEQSLCQLLNLQDPLGLGLPQPARPPGTKEREEKKHEYRAIYRKYTGYKYDIKKTSSIVTPYTGYVSFIFNVFEKRGNTLQECSSTDWKLVEINGKEFTFNQEYAFQNAQWVLMDKRSRKR